MKHAEESGKKYHNAQILESNILANYENEMGNYLIGNRNETKGKLVRKVLDTFNYRGDITSVKTYDVKNIPGYENFTTDNFCISLDFIQTHGGIGNGININGVNTKLEYENGILTVDLPPHIREVNGMSPFLGVPIVLHYVK